MSLLSLALWLAGAVLIALAVWRVRGPYARLQDLDRLADNARRYDSWRGGRRTAADRDERTGADVMREHLRRTVYAWLAVGAAGIVLLVAGFVVG